MRRMSSGDAAGPSYIWSAIPAGSQYEGKPANRSKFRLVAVTNGGPKGVPSVTAPVMPMAGAARTLA